MAAAFHSPSCSSGCTASEPSAPLWAAVFSAIRNRRRPFLLPLLYQVGLGFTPIQSGLLVMPQAIAAMSMKTIIPWLLGRMGYRGILVSNTLVLGALPMVFATIGLRTPIWAIVLQAFLYGAFTSLQYSSMNTLVYADITDKDTSSASSIANTIQQMFISFGVATAGLATAFFIPTSGTDPAEIIHGIHKALVHFSIRSFWG